MSFLGIDNIVDFLLRSFAANWQLWKTVFVPSVSSNFRMAVPTVDLNTCTRRSSHSFTNKTSA